MPDSSLHVAVIGLGAMGLPMASHLATTFAVTGFDPFEPRRELAREAASLPKPPAIRYRLKQATQPIAAGKYTFVCDPHKSNMHGSFTVK